MPIFRLIDKVSDLCYKLNINLKGDVGMKSIKPGRGPSGMGVFAGIIVSLFGVFWLIIAVSMGAFIMIPFGLLFIAMAIGKTIYSYKNATGENRYSEFDIVDENEEPDPGAKPYRDVIVRENERKNFCPYCGTKAEEGHKFCGNCGSKLE